MFKEDGCKALSWGSVGKKLPEGLAQLLGSRHLPRGEPATQDLPWSRAWNGPIKTSTRFSAKGGRGKARSAAGEAMGLGTTVLKNLRSTRALKTAVIKTGGPAVPVVFRFEEVVVFSCNSSFGFSFFVLGGRIIEVGTRRA